MRIKNPNNLKFNEELHLYKLEGVKIPSVTQVINSFLPFPMQGVSLETRLFYLERGSEVHSICEDYLRGTLNVRSIDPTLVGYFKSFKTWADDFIHKTEAVEIESFMVLGNLYSGQMDICLPDRKSEFIIDIKSGGESRVRDSMQLMAYRGGTHCQMANLYLDQNGGPARFKIRRAGIEERYWYRIFMCQVSVLNFVKTF